MTAYLISSIRAGRRSDERNCVFNTTNQLAEGDTIILDGLVWFVTKVLRGEEK